MTDILDNLQPAGGKHAISEVVFQVNFHPDTRLIDPQLYIDRLKNDLAEVLPKSEITKAVSGQVDANGVSFQQQEKAGFLFEKYKTDGTVEYIFHGENQQPGQHPWIAANLLHYNGWPKAVEKAIEWFRLVPKVQTGLMVHGITLNYVDQFIWASQDIFPADEVFNFSKSSYLPTYLQDGLENWSSQLSYSHRNEKRLKVENVNVAFQTNEQTFKKRVLITTPLNIAFLKARPYDELLDENEQLLRLYSELHEDNKRILHDILTDKVCKKIGLKT